MRFWKSPPWYLLMAVTVLLFGANLYQTFTHQNTTSNDFLNYAIFIAHMKSSGTVTTPHFIYPGLVLLLSEIFVHHNTMVLGGFVVLLFQLFLAHILWNFWKQSLGNGKREIPESLAITESVFHPFRNGWLLVALTVTAMTVAPINLLTLIKHNGYNGYIGITIYHNPPISLCRPIALLNVMIFAAALVYRRISTRQTLFCFLTLVIAALTKPNYALIMVPTACVFALDALNRKDWPILRFIAFGVLLPGLLVLGWQYVFTYLNPPASSDMDSSRILFAPFMVYSIMARFLIPKFFLSILFPLSILILYRKEALRDRYYQIGLLLFLMGAAQSYFFAEEGVRLIKGNFLWSGQLGLFLWFVISMRFVVQRFFSEPDRTRWSAKYLVLSGIFALHVVSGILWYIVETTSPGAYW